MTDLRGGATPTRADRPLRCWLVALLSGWVTMVFASSALIVLRGVPNAMTRPGVGHAGSVAATRRVADEMGPAAKLLLVVLFAVLLWLGERLDMQQISAVPKHVVQPQERLWTAYAVNIVLAVAAMMLTLALVPTNYSRGFGVGLTGARFSALVLPLYLCSAALGALAYTFSLTRCRARGVVT